MSRKRRPTTVLTLTGRAQIVCDSDDSLTDVTKHLNTVFIENYSRDFIESNTYIRSNDSSNNSYTTRATIPYIRGTSETIARILRSNNIQVGHKPCSVYDAYSLMLRTMTILKTDQKRFTRSNAPTARPQTTGTNFTTRLNEHKRTSKKGDLNIAEHHLTTSETIGWDSATCLTYSTDYYQRQLRPRNLRATRKRGRTRKRRPTRKIRPRKFTGK